MKKEIRTIVYDEQLQVEAYRLEGIVKPFPNHFHDFYVVGMMLGGERYLCCKGKEYQLKKGNMILFNPGDNHTCAQIGNSTLNYCAFNIEKERMLTLMKEAGLGEKLPVFNENVITNAEAFCYFKPLHEMIMSGSNDLKKEEKLILLLSRFIRNDEKSYLDEIPEYPKEIEKVCFFMKSNYEGPISLSQLCGYAGLSKSTLLRAFTKSKGVTPYRYLETIRINEAKKLLQQGLTPVETAIRTGFSDQSHFTKYFTSFTGVSPGIYSEIFQ